MSVEIILPAASGGLYVMLGGLHDVYSIADVQRPRRFVPDDPAVPDHLPALGALLATLCLLTAAMLRWWLGS